MLPSQVSFGSPNWLLMKILELMLIASFAGKLRLSQLATDENLELMTGIEPVTSPLPRECSTN